MRNTQQMSVLEIRQIHVGHQESLLLVVKRRRLAWFGHVRRHDTFFKGISQGTVVGERRRGKQRKSWNCNIKVQYMKVARTTLQGVTLYGRHFRLDGSILESRDIYLSIAVCVCVVVFFHIKNRKSNINCKMDDNLAILVNFRANTLGFKWRQCFR